MSDYVIRVELNGYPDGSVYDRLHEAMYNARAKRTILADDGLTYALPHATYIGTSDLNPVATANLILDVVRPIWKDCDVIVFRYDGVGLKLTPVRGIGLRAA